MSKSRKIILISLLPVLLTVVFIIYAVMPAIGNLNKLKSDLETEKQALSETQCKLDSLRQNKKLLKEVQKLRNKLADFEMRVPSEDDLAILFVDLGKFSSNFNVRVFSVSSSPEKPVKIIDPKQQEPEENKKSKRNKEKETQELPVSLFAIPLEIKVIGYYPDIMKFISTLENYQREIVIDGISISNSIKDKDTIKPKVELTIDCTIYKLTEKLIEAESNSDEPKKEG
ncbi:MAG: hypothetical protein A2104_08665 [Candidatus Melainabacteria bacterium GWF2_32_7]|nr:MAG: hypothetical protein A2104_08665 [Candidatus Melainabacteria bacterium GWF2_32_7]